MPPINVIFVRNARGITDLTGGERYLLTLLDHLDPKLVSTSLLTAYDPRKGETAWLREVKQRSIPYQLVAAPSMFTLADYRALVAMAQQRQANIIHSLDHRGDVAGTLAAKWTGAAAVASFFGWTNFESDSKRARIYPMIDRWALRNADAVIVDSEEIGSQIDQGPERTPLVRIPHGIDTERFDPTRIDPSVRSLLCSENAELLVGTVGRIHPNKGHLDFVEIAARIHARYPQVHFVIIGDPSPGHEDYYQQVLARVDQHKLKGVLRITNVPSARIPDALGNMDIVLQASHLESFSIAALEALAMRRPLIATDVGGMAKMVVHEKSGIIVPPRNPSTAADALSALIENPEQRARIASRGRQHLLNNYTIDSMMHRTTETYRRIVEWRAAGKQRRDKRTLHAILNAKQ